MGSYKVNCLVLTGLNIPAQDNVTVLAVYRAMRRQGYNVQLLSFAHTRKRLSNTLKSVRVIEDAVNSHGSQARMQLPARDGERS